MKLALGSQDCQKPVIPDSTQEFRHLIFVILAPDQVEGRLLRGFRHVFFWIPNQVGDDKVINLTYF